MPRSPQLLQVLCACLSAGQRGDRSDASLAAALADPAVDLMAFARLADRHLVTPMLAAYIGSPDIRSRLPEEFGVYVDFMHSENLKRNTSLQQELVRIATCLNSIDIEPLVLKGAIRLVDGLYPDLGWRFMRDLDILVPETEVDRAVDGLMSAGYRFTRKTDDFPEGHRHLPPLQHDDSDNVVEIHTDLMDAQELMPAEQVLARSQQRKLSGATVRVPDAPDQIGHLIGHDRFDKSLRRSGMFLLRSLFETAMLCRDERAVEELRARFAGTRLARYSEIWFALTNHLFADHLSRPIDVGRDKSMMAHALLRLEHIDEAGRFRRFVGYGRLQLSNFFRSPGWRKHFTTNLRDVGYWQYCAKRVRNLWLGN